VIATTPVMILRMAVPSPIGAIMKFRRAGFLLPPL
jgi:hypothetical protein